MSARGASHTAELTLLAFLLAGLAACVPSVHADASPTGPHLMAWLAPSPVPQTNMPPVANFTIFPEEGGAGTVFVLNASLSYDAEDSVDRLEFRWDFFDDGRSDVDWSREPVARFASQAPGPAPIRLWVRDSGGLTDTILREISVVGSSTASMAGLIPYVLVALIVSLVFVAVLVLKADAISVPPREAEDPEEPPIREP